MDLRGIANSVSSQINPNKLVSVLVSNGVDYVTGPGARQMPVYADPVEGPAQIQALDGNDLKQLDGMNIQGVIKAIYLRGVLAGVIRPKQVGGDLILIDGETWLVVKVLEGWPTWTKAAIALQTP